MDENLKREIILENYQNPMNKEVVNDDRYIKVNTNNESCIDNLDIYILVEDNIIKDIKFDGEACAISTSSTSIMIHNLIGKTIDETIKYMDEFDKMVNEQEYDKDYLNEAIVYDGIYKQANRKHCALLPYLGIKKALEKLYNKEKFHILSKEEYIDIVINQLELLDEKIVINRITGDPKIDDLIEPKWLVKKFCVLNDIDKEMKTLGNYQGIKVNRI